jgi:hypothetical protein
VKQEQSEAEQQRLAELKRLIQSGEYETEEKLEIALRRMLPDLRRGGAGAALTPEDDSAGGSP